MGKVTEAPWDDCKVAFGIEDEAPVWKHWGTSAQTVHPLPSGWELCETDGAGARWVAVFRIAGIPTRDDALTVKALLRRIGAMRRFKARAA